MSDQILDPAVDAKGDDEKLVMALEKLVGEKVLQKLRQPLQAVVREAVAEAVIGAVRVQQKPPRRKTTNLRPKAGGRCEAVWSELDRLRRKTDVPSLKSIMTIGERKHWNANNTRIEYYAWRKAHGIGGRVPTA